MKFLAKTVLTGALGYLTACNSGLQEATAARLLSDFEDTYAAYSEIDPYTDYVEAAPVQSRTTLSGIVAAYSTSMDGSSTLLGQMTMHTDFDQNTITGDARNFREFNNVDAAVIATYDGQITYAGTIDFSDPVNYYTIDADFSGTISHALATRVISSDLSGDFFETSKGLSSFGYMDGTVVTNGVREDFRGDFFLTE